MTSAPTPKNEKDRLAAVRRYAILDTAPESMFDDVVQLVSYICQTPIAYIGIIDKDRQWFKSKKGLDTPETSRDIAFCAHAILETHTMVVPDALADQRFANNPLVLSAPKIRFYAGSPLITEDGYAVGTLCAVDHVPRNLTEDQLKALQTLAKQTVALLELHRSHSELQDALNQIRILGGLLPICSNCKKIRDERGQWVVLEGYIQSHSEATFTHGTCPECYAKLYGDRLRR